MSRKEKRKSQNPPVASISDQPKAPTISRRGWKIIFAGLALLAAGYITLAFADPRGQNLASDLSPLLIIMGYTAVGVGIVARDPIA